MELQTCSLNKNIQQDNKTFDNIFLKYKNIKLKRNSGYLKVMKNTKSISHVKHNIEDQDQLERLYQHCQLLEDDEA